MTILESFRDWVEAQSDEVEILDGLALVTMGETGDLAPPFLGFMESGVEDYVQDGVTMYGVSVYEVTIELHTVPADTAEEGTPADTEREMRRALSDIIQDRDCIEFMAMRNEWQVFDIRPGNPITEANEGRRVTRWIATVIAAPL